MPKVLNVNQKVQLVEVSQDRDGQRLDNYLGHYLKGLPKSAVYRLIRTGQVRVNGGRAKPMQKLAVGDQVRIPPVKMGQQKDAVISSKVLNTLAEAVLHEDDSLMVIDKPAGMAVHGGSGLAWGVVDAVRRLRPDDNIELAHRLDRETSGCLVLAKSRQALNVLTRQFRERSPNKFYLALLEDRMTEMRVDVYLPLRKQTGGGGESIVVIDEEEGKPAHTRFMQMHRYADATFVEVELFTGRTHQIRVHAASMGLPIAGDVKYGNGRLGNRWQTRGLNRLFLHAHRIQFESPKGEELMINAPLPSDLRQVLGTCE